VIPFADWLERQGAARPAAPAVICEDERWSFAALAAASRRLAGWLATDAALAPGARVAWLGHNRPEMLALLFACARRGLLLTPLNWRLGDPEIAAILDDARPGLVVVDDSCRERLSAVAGWPLAGCRWHAPAALAWPDAAGDAAGTERSAADAAAPVLLVYTSGTTGRPKGAVLTQRALECNAENAVHMHDLRQDDLVLTVLPLFHVGGLNIQTLPALRQGATVLLEPRFDPGRTLALMRTARPTLTLQVPTTIAALTAHPDWAATDLSALRCIATGSTDVPLALIEAVHARGVPVIQIYGATETGPVAIYQQVAEAYATAGSIGRAGLHTEVALRDPEGRPVRVGEAGEIHVRGAHVADGYWDATAGRAVPFPDGWFASGDVAVQDAQGCYWFKGRRKHVIISGGENIYPAELERVLAASGLVREAAVAGRADPRWGEVPVVIAVPGDDAVDKAAVLALFEGTLARYKHPHDVIFTDALPRNALGKVEIERLRELARRA
jgi:fatty-acyl-CoA synthase